MAAKLLLCVGLLATCGLAMGQDIVRDCSGPPPSASPKLCCPFMDQGSVFNETVYETCWFQYADFPMIPIPGGGLSGGPAGCAAECFFSGLDLLIQRQDYTIIDLYALDRHVKEIASEERYEFVSEAVYYCVNEANRRAPIFAEIQRRPAVVEGLENCNPISGFAFSCMHVYAIRNCPNWTPDGTEGCDDLLDFYNQCPFNPY